MNISASRFVNLLDVNTGNIPPSLDGDGLKIPQVSADGTQINLVSVSSIIPPVIGVIPLQHIPVGGTNPPILQDSGVQINVATQDVTNVNSIQAKITDYLGIGDSSTINYNLPTQPPSLGQSLVCTNATVPATINWQSASAPTEILVTAKTNNETYYPTFVSSPSTITQSIDVDGHGSLTYNPNSKLLGTGGLTTSNGQGMSLNGSGTQNVIDLYTISANNEILTFNSATNTLLLGAGISGTADATLTISNNSTSIKPIHITNTNGSLSLNSKTGLTATDAVSTTITETTDSHSLSMSSSGVSLVCGNSLPLTITTQGSAGTIGNVLTLGSSGAVWQAPSGGGGSVGASGEINVSDGLGGWTDSNVNITSQIIGAAGSIELLENTSGNNLTIGTTTLSMGDSSNGNTITSSNAGLYFNSANNYPFVFNNGATNLLYLQNGGSVLGDGTNTINMYGLSGIVINASAGNPCFTVNDTVVGNQILFQNSGVVLTSGSGQNLQLNTAGGGNLNLNISGTGVTLNTGGGTSTITISIGSGGSSYPLILPSHQGAAGTTLRNNGSGVLTWAV